MFNPKEGLRVLLCAPHWRTIPIAIGDCISVGGFQYSLIFVNRATSYNWVFGLKNLSKESILSAFHLFLADAGCLEV